MSSKPKVICLGLGRTGTTSLMAALDDLGFGPCYHMKVIGMKQDPDEINAWYNLGQGLATIDDMRAVLKDYNSVLDYPPSIYYDKVYEAYPDAKYILTTRDPAKWEASVKATIIKATDAFQAAAESNPSPFLVAMSRWFTVEMEGRYHQNKLRIDAQGELIAHNQRVMQLIPSDKLLVYEVNQGWDPLVEFLGVEKPDKPFPHVHDTAQFQQKLGEFMEYLRKDNPPAQAPESTAARD